MKTVLIVIGFLTGIYLSMMLPRNKTGNVMRIIFIVLLVLFALFNEMLWKI
jgi:hypothetical protein